jgi:hypothetical protein
VDVTEFVLPGWFVSVGVWSLVTVLTAATVVGLAWALLWLVMKGAYLAKLYPVITSFAANYHQGYRLVDGRWVRRGRPVERVSTSVVEVEKDAVIKAAHDYTRWLESKRPEPGEGQALKDEYTEALGRLRDARRWWE